MTSDIRVLVVDDDPQVREALQDELSAHFQVVTAADGNEALKHLAVTRFDALITDIRMPGMDGLELAERAREIDADVPQIFLTGYADERVYTTAAGSPGTYKLDKPWSDDLEIVIRRAVEDRRRRTGMIQDLHRLVQAGELAAASPGSTLDDVVARGVEVIVASDAVESVAFFVQDCEGGWQGAGAVTESLPAVEELLGPGSDGDSMRLLQHHDGWLCVIPKQIGHDVKGVAVVTLCAVDDRELRHLEFAVQRTFDALATARLYADLERRHRELAQAQVRLVRLEKMASLGLISAAMTHEICNPLGAVQCNLAFIERVVSELRDHDSDPVATVTAEVQEALEETKEGMRRVNAIIGSLRSFCHPGSSNGDRTAVDVGDCLANVLRLLGFKVKGAVALDIHESETAYVLGNEGELGQVFLNVIDNGLQAVSTHGGTVSVRWEQDDEQVHIFISDDGPGVAADVLPRVFEPFVTTKGNGEGTGLGLAIARDIVERHGGAIQIQSEVGSATCVQISLPSAGEVEGDRTPEAG